MVKMEIEEFKKMLLEKIELAKAQNIREYYKQIAMKENPRMNIKYAKYFARKNEINVDKINFELLFVEDTMTNKLFKSAMSFWSVPLTVGYGRRIRMIVYDKGNNKVAGIIGLCDPVIGLSIRDKYVGWNKEQKTNRLYNMLSAYVLGAVPPYNELLTGKMVALAAGTKEVRDYFRRKYADKTTIIRQEKKINELIAIDTTAFFGMTPIYHGLKEWKFLGYTQGYTTMHFNDIWNDIVAFGRKYLNIQAKNGYGNGPSYKIRVMAEISKKLGISKELLTFLQHQKGYYFRPLVENWQDFLQMKTDFVEKETCKSFEEYQEYWKKKFFKKGIERYAKM